jgi:hypothetical protein
MSSSRIVCSCGSVVNKRSYSSHKSTLKHQKFSNPPPIPPPHSLAIRPRAILPHVSRPSVISYPNSISTISTIVSRTFLVQPQEDDIDYSALDDESVPCPTCTFLQNCYNQTCDVCESSMHPEVPHEDTLSEETIVSSDWAECCICMDRKSNIVFIPCGHMCVCDKDLENMKDKKCPVCRSKIKMSQKVYCS